MDKEKEAALTSIFKGGGIIFLGTMFSKAFSLFYRVIVGSELGPATYGVISVMMSVFSVVTVIAYLGMPNSVQHFVSHFRSKGDLEKAQEMVNYALTSVILSSTIIGLILFILAPFLSRTVFGNPELVWPIRIVALILPLRGVGLVFAAITDAFEKMQYKVYTERIWNSIPKLIILVISVTLGWGAVGAAGAFAFPFATAFILNYVFAKKVFPSYQLKPKIKIRSIYKNGLGRLGNHSLPLMFSGAVGIFSGNIDTFVIQIIKGSSQVGLYQAAFPFAALITISGSIFNTIFFSNASKLRSKGKDSELLETYHTVIKWTIFTSIPAFLILFTFPKIGILIFGREYLDAVNTLRVLALGFMFSTFIGPVNKIYQATEETQIDFYTSVLNTGLNLVMNIILVSILFGPLGAAIATASSIIITNTIHTIYIKRLLGETPFNKSLLKPLIAGIISISTVYILNNLLFTDTPIWFFIIDTIIFGLLYLIILFKMKFFGEEERMILRKTIAKIRNQYYPILKNSLSS
jgi:O-antigen/teichoic acid export membrane protein